MCIRDRTGISFYYNKTAFEALGLEAPQTWEELLETCQTLRDNGYENPITVGQEASWILASLADAGFRYEESEFLVQPGDAIYDAETMSANDGFVFDDNNLSCDAFTVTSTERMLAARKKDVYKRQEQWSAAAILAQRTTLALAFPSSIFDIYFCL